MGRKLIFELVFLIVSFAIRIIITKLDFGIEERLLGLSLELHKNEASKSKDFKVNDL